MRHARVRLGLAVVCVSLVGLSACGADQSDGTGSAGSDSVAGKGNGGAQPSAGNGGRTSGNGGQMSGAGGTDAAGSGGCSEDGCAGAQGDCGDGQVDSGEACDDGKETASCDADCTTVTCGDKTLNAAAGEACDDGNTKGGDGCSKSCQVEECGNDVVDDGEACDDGGQSTVKCDSDCTAVKCGDGLKNAVAGEDCDDGKETAQCNADCTTARCGDTKVNMTQGEQCDDGNKDKTDACIDCVKARCGDGIRQLPNEGTGVPGEACDDGVETADCTKNCKVSSCGDKYINAAAGETCDDGAQVGGDGCDPLCHKEP